MRLYPSAPLLGRRAVEDDEIRGYRIPAGADVVVAPWVVHRHPDFWDRPQRFDPQRFTPEREKARHRYAGSRSAAARGDASDSISRCSSR